MMVAFKGRLPFFLTTIALLHNFDTVVASSGGVMGGFSSDYSSSFSGSSYSSMGDNYGYGGDDGGGWDRASRVEKLIAISLLVSIGLIPLICCLINRKSVVKLQIALSGSARSLQKELDKTAGTTNTSTSKGLNSMLHNTASTLLKHSEYWISGYSYVGRTWTMHGMQSLFNALSWEEREKFDVETLVNINNVKVQREFVPRGERCCKKEFFVVTILVGANGSCFVPNIRNKKSLKKGLEKLKIYETMGGDSVQVLWTPQNENDSLLPEELLANYPFFMPI